MKNTQWRSQSDSAEMFPYNNYLFNDKSGSVQISQLVEKLDKQIIFCN